MEKYQALINKIPNGKDPEVQKKIKEILIDKELILQEGERKQVLLRPDVQFQLEEAKSAIVFSAVLDDYMQANITDDELKSIVAQQGGKEYRARHILVEKPEQAQNLLKELQAGKSFADLARQYSVDKASGSNGGDLDWAKADVFVPEFAKALSGMQKGDVSKQAVKTQFGYHLIMLDDVRDNKAPDLASVKPQLLASLKANPEFQRQKFEQLRKELRAKAKIQ